MTKPPASDPRHNRVEQCKALLEEDPAKALSEARRLVAENTGDPAALLLLGRALRATGDVAGAATAEQQSIQAATRRPVHAQAIAALRAGDFLRANTLLKQILDFDSDDVLALSLLGLQASRASEFELADDMLGRAVRLAPADDNARLAHAEHLYRSRRYAAALEALALLSSAGRTSEQARLLKSDCLGEMGRLEEQLAILRELASVHRDPTVYHLRMGHALRSLGRAGEAESAYRSVIARNPSEGTSWWSLANLKSLKFSDDDLSAMKRALTVPNMPVTNRIRLNFALGKAYQDRGDAQSAFSHFDEGNRLRSSISPYDPGVIKDWVDRSIAAFDHSFFERQGDKGAASNAPIFIVGMQRSGSTLVEQILSAHPAIEATAELPDLPNLVRQVSQEAHRSGQRFEDALATAGAGQLQAWGETYLANAETHRLTQLPHFIDKMPNNWSHVAFIRLILPNARIIDVRRDPMDCCVSNWTQLYARGLDLTNALDTVGAYYSDYVRLMRHIDEVQTGAVHRVIYEDLVDDLEREVRAMLDYLGLPFERACLDFHKADRAVRTISAEQVRQPINRKGIGRWRMYEQWLAPLVDALGPTAKDWRQ